MYCMPFGIAIQTFIEILSCSMVHLLTAYIAQHMILPWHVIGYYSLGCYCTSYGIVIWTFVYIIYIYIYIYICIHVHCLKASCLLYCGHIMWILLQTIGDHSIGYYGMSHGLVISMFIEVPYCIIFLLHGIILNIAW